MYQKGLSYGHQNITDVKKDNALISIQIEHLYIPQSFGAFLYQKKIRGDSVLQGLQVFYNVVILL